MGVLVQHPAPDFKAQAVMPDGSFKTISMSEFAGKKYVLLFFYPLDFTFVCPTEIIAFSDRAAEFEVQLRGAIPRRQQLRSASGTDPDEPAVATRLDERHQRPLGPAKRPRIAGSMPRNC